MGIEITALKNAVADADTYARTLQGQGRLEAAEVVYETLLRTLHTLLDAGEEPRGALRVAHLVTQTRRRLMLDALEVARAGELQLRAGALLYLPEQAALNSLEDIHTIIAAAINVGAPRYNAGDVRGCCAVYWITIHALVTIPAARGVPGHARTIGLLRPLTEGAPPVVPLDTLGIDDLAWTYRNALDAVLKVTG